MRSRRPRLHTPRSDQNWAAAHSTARGRDYEEQLSRFVFQDCPDRLLEPIEVQDLANLRVKVIAVMPPPQFVDPRLRDDGARVRAIELQHARFHAGGLLGAIDRGNEPTSFQMIVQRGFHGSQPTAKGTRTRACAPDRSSPAW